MARSLTHNPMAFVAEVARYLCMEPQDIERMCRLDKLPHVDLPKAKRTVKRIPLRDFHAWLQARSKNPAPVLASYDTFLADFDAARTKHAA